MMELDTEAKKAKRNIADIYGRLMAHPFLLHFIHTIPCGWHVFRHSVSRIIEGYAIHSHIELESVFCCCCIFFLLLFYGLQ